MRKIFAILTICAIMLLSACQQAELPKSTDPPVQSTASSSYVEESQEAETQETTVSTTASSQPVITETSTTETTVPETTVTTEETKPKQTEPAQTSTEENTTPTERKPKETEPEVTKPAETQSQEITDTGKTDEPVPTDPVIVRADPTDVEQLVAVYLNQHRNAAGASSATVLPGLTTVARYRSVQLISNFAHANSATVCTELQYGQFVDMTQYGMSESDSYYQGYNREALAKGNWGGTAEEVARKIADGLKNSPNHWKYLSSAEYGYMAVGCTYSEATNMWYCCVCMSSENYGG